MGIPEAKFRIGMDGSPFSSTVVLEVYEEEDRGLGYLREMESLHDMKMRSPEELLQEAEPEEYEFRFSLEDKELELYDRIFRNAIEERRAKGLEEPVKEALYTLEVFDSVDDGIEKESYSARYSKEEAPEDIIKAFSLLERTAYENMLD